ncbi:transposase [Streptomyces sp. NPDC056656]|uniref:transposase n=1 Tax=Streptomyces sp. NPDC056656 TaxID=3345895 RepID=UPI0036CA6C0E
MGKKKPRPRRSVTPEFKAEIIEVRRRGDRSVGQVAKDFDLTETAVRLWVSQAEVDAGERDGLTSSEREELAALRRENRRLREDVDILKRAARGPGLPLRRAWKAARETLSSASWPRAAATSSSHLRG